MRISSVKLVNFNCYEDAKFSFTPGLNVVVLPNGGGKSSLIEGISFAIYGSRVLESSVKTYIREGSIGASLVNLEGEFNSEHFSLTRYLKPSRVNFTWKNTKIKKLDELTDFWKHKLIPPSLFKATICCNQREAAILAQAKPALRRKMISELLRFDVVTEAISSLNMPLVKSTMSISQEQIDTLQRELNELKDVDPSLEGFHREQIYLLEQVARESPEIEAQRSQFTQELSSLSFLCDLLEKAVNASGVTTCPVCGSLEFDRKIVQDKLLQIKSRLQEVRRQLAQLPPSAVLTEDQRKRIRKGFSVEDHRKLLSLIEKKKACEASLSSLLRLREQLVQGQVVAQARAILRDFLDSTSVPLLNSISSLTSRLLTGSPFREVTLTSSFDLEVDGRSFNKLSTGQRDFVAVVFRIAVSYITSALHGVEQFPLLLDSIGDSLDESLFSALMSLLSSEVTKLFPQIILTTHHT